MSFKKFFFCSFFFFLDELKKQLALQRRQRAAHGKIKLTMDIPTSKT